LSDNNMFHSVPAGQNAPEAFTEVTGIPCRLVEICCHCGFVHRDDRFGVKQHKFHYHWEVAPAVIISDIHVKPTICATCLDHMGWASQWRQCREQSASKYKCVPGSRNPSCVYNAGLDPKQYGMIINHVLNGKYEDLIQAIGILIDHPEV